MFQNIGFTEILLIAVVALILFGPQKLPELGRTLGRAIFEFKKSTRDLLSDAPASPPATATPPAPAAPQPSVAAPAEVPAATTEAAGSTEAAAAQPAAPAAKAPSNPRRLPD